MVLNTHILTKFGLKRSLWHNSFRRNPQEFLKIVHSQTKGENMYTLSELKEEYYSICNSLEFGVKGIVAFDSGVAGPCVGVTMMTHGSEPSGLAALRHFRASDMIRKLQKGKVIFVLNNVAAAEKYFAALDIVGQTEGARVRLSARFLDVNMNRLPADMPERVNDSRYEIIRSRELLPVWKRCNIAITLVKSLLQNLGMIQGEGLPELELRKEYNISGSVFFPNASYRLVKKFTPFEFVEAGSIIAEGDGEPIRVATVCHIILPRPGIEATGPLNDEVMFLSSPVKTVES